MNRVLSNHRFIHTSPGFSVQGLLDRINSPRLTDMPELANWIEAAADDAGVSAELMCVIPEKEQSGLTDREIRPFGLRAFCGYGVSHPGEEPRPEWSGPEKQLRAAAWRLRWLFYSSTSAEVNNWIARVGERFGPVDIIPENAATAALYSYTPSISDKHNFQSIWRRWFGDPLEEECKVMKATTEDVARIARRVAESHAAGNNTCSINGIHFTMAPVWKTRRDGTRYIQGYCTRFVRKVHEAALGLHDSTWEFRSSDAVSLEGSLKAARKKVDSPVPGDIICINRDSGVYGHVAIALGDGLVAENTSSTKRGPGTVVSKLSEIGLGRVSGYYRAVPLPTNGVLKVVGPDGEAIDCHPVEEGGITRVDLRPVAEAIDHDVYYRTMEQGPRIYLKRRP